LSLIIGSTHHTFITNSHNFSEIADMFAIFLSPYSVIQDLILSIIIFFTFSYSFGIIDNSQMVFLIPGISHFNSVRLAPGFAHFSTITDTCFIISSPNPKSLHFSKSISASISNIILVIFVHFSISAIEEVFVILFLSSVFISENSQFIFFISSLNSSNFLDFSNSASLTDLISSTSFLVFSKAFKGFFNPKSFVILFLTSFTFLTGTPLSCNSSSISFIFSAIFVHFSISAFPDSGVIFHSISDLNSASHLSNPFIALSKANLSGDFVI